MTDRVVLHRKLREAVDIAGKTREVDPVTSCTKLIEIVGLCKQILDSYEV